jgi:regulator of replication initiation timing
MNENPLSQYFRTPAIHLALPSSGKFYADGVIDMPETGEVPVLPMTAIDEITYKTPDALFNGSAVATVIESCVPAIKDAWQMPATDLTAVLCAIRIASFGHEMELPTVCPKCGNTEEYSVDLREVLDSIKMPDYSKMLQIGDLKIMFKPMTYKDLNENNKLQFEEQKLNQMLKDTEVDEATQIKLLSESFKKVSDYTISTLANNIGVIVTPDCTVSEYEHILEFLRKCGSVSYRKIKSAVIEQKKTELLKPLKIKCEAHIPLTEEAPKDKEPEVCGHEYEQPFTLDMTSFFDQS